MSTENAVAAETLTEHEVEAAMWLRALLDAGGLGGTEAEDEKVRVVCDALVRLAGPPSEHIWPCPHFYVGMAAYDPGRPCTCQPAAESDGPTPANTLVHNHRPWRPMCNERVVDGQKRGACLNDDGTDRA